LAVGWDIVVAGSGNAALAAALSAAEQGARVVVLEKATSEEAGGNSRFAGGLYRSIYGGYEDLARVIPELSHQEWLATGSRTYSREDYRRDIERMCGGKIDGVLTEFYIDRSLDTLVWMASHEVQFMFAGPDAYGQVNPGAAIWARGEGRAAVASLTRACERHGVTFFFDTAVTGLISVGGTVIGVETLCSDGSQGKLYASATVLGCGGFEASAELRMQHLGREWEHVRVRGTRHNTGDLLPALRELGARFVGEWGDCHATPVHADAPTTGELDKLELEARHDYSYGVLVNLNGKRFVDEGENFRLFTYAKTGRAILAQPAGRAYQIFDAKVRDRLDYRYQSGSRFEAQTIEELAEQLDVNRSQLIETISSYNEACPNGQADFASLDGLATEGLPISKSNWAQRIDEPPFLACPVACGITFTYGGIRTDTMSRALNQADQPIPGLFVVGELQGGLFAQNYPGGAGLMRGAVFGREAGRGAAALAGEVVLAS
jgi:tricarballylate dehydrogenase